MIEDHREAFFEIAEEFKRWIGVREPNPLSEPWIGVSNYVPKPLVCKAKTADNPGHRLRGLVVDPTICSNAFQSRSLETAITKWAEFAPGDILPPNFSRVLSGADTGLVQFHGKGIHTDYDLMAICQSGSHGEMLPTKPHQERQFFLEIVQALNFELGTPMIQHGTEFMFDKGVGARHGELVLWFGPGKLFRCGPVSMQLNKTT